MNAPPSSQLVFGSGPRVSRVPPGLWIALRLVVALAILATAATDASAQPLPPRLVVLEGFYNPG